VLGQVVTRGCCCLYPSQGVPTESTLKLPPLSIPMSRMYLCLGRTVRSTVGVLVVLWGVLWGVRCGRGWAAVQHVWLLLGQRGVLWLFLFWHPSGVLAGNTHIRHSLPSTHLLCTVPVLVCRVHIVQILAPIRLGDSACGACVGRMHSVCWEGGWVGALHSVNGCC
jgi:hypothetical protein